MKPRFAMAAEWSSLRVMQWLSSRPCGSSLPARNDAYDDSWLIRTEGTSADGERISATQSLKFDGKDAFLWNSHDRLVDGEKQADVDLRVVRQTPEPEAK